MLAMLEDAVEKEESEEKDEHVDDDGDGGPGDRLGHRVGSVVAGGVAAAGVGDLAEIAGDDGEGDPEVGRVHRAGSGDVDGTVGGDRVAVVGVGVPGVGDLRRGSRVDGAEVDGGVRVTVAVGGVDPEEVGPGTRVMVTAGGRFLIGVAVVEVPDELEDGVDVVEGNEDEGGLGVWKSVSDTEDGEEGSEEEIDMAVSGCKSGCFIYIYLGR